MLSRSLFPWAGAVLLVAFALGAKPVLAAQSEESSTNQPVCTATNDQHLPQIVSDGAGGAIVTWSDFRSGSNLDIYAQGVTAAGLVDPTWPLDGVALCTAANDQSQPQLVSDGAGGAIVTWQDYRNGNNLDIYAQRVAAAGLVDPTWSPDGVALCAATNDQSRPQLVSDGTGGAIVTWQDSRSGNYDIYAQHVTAAGVVHPIWQVDGVALCTATNDQTSPQIVSDGAGGAIVTWQDWRSANSDIYAQHVTAAGVVDPTWPVDGVALCVAIAPYQPHGPPQLVSDGAGGAIATWRDRRYDCDICLTSDIYTQHVTAAGVADPAWPVNGLDICTAMGHKYDPELVSDGSGGAIIAWVDIRSTALDIYAQRVLATGTVDPAWPADGRALCTTNGPSEDPTIVSDGAGGAVVTWRDWRSTNYDIYAQHVNIAGEVDPTWPVDGVALCTAAGHQEYPQLVSDEAGGAIVTWQDNRSGNLDIYAQRVQASASLGGPEPTIVGVEDVPDDQGGKIHVLWSSSNLDHAPAYRISIYTLWRKLTIDSALQALGEGAALVSSRSSSTNGLAERRIRATIDGEATTYWEFIESIPARGVGHYAYTVSTTTDSMPGLIPYNVFFVDAMDDATGEFYISDPDSGYSVDNLAPAVPQSLSGEYSAGTTTLHWMPNSEADFAAYCLYRGKVEDFAPAPGNLVVTQTDTGYVDAVGEPYFYKLSAVDVHGNESPYALLQPDGTVGIEPEPDRPSYFTLYPSAPNPLRDHAVFRFDLSAVVSVELSIYDARGRIVRHAMVAAAMPAGQHEWQWNVRDDSGARVPPGIYFITLETPLASQTRKVIVLE